MSKRTIILTLIAVILALLFIVPFIIPQGSANGRPPHELGYSNSMFSTIHGINVHYRKWGNGAPRILLFHGFGSHTYTWESVAASLARYGTVIAFDRPGFGLTERPLKKEWHNASPYSLARSVAIAEALAKKTTNKLILIGNSMGGNLITAFAASNAAIVRAAVYIDAPAFSSYESSPFRFVLKIPQIRHLLPRIIRTSFPETGMELLYRAWHNTNALTKDVRSNYLIPMRAKDWDKGLAYFAASQQDFPHAIEHAAGFTFPSLIIHGAGDRVVGITNAYMLKNSLRNSTLAIISNCGHVPQEECPEGTLRHIDEFFQKIGISPRQGSTSNPR